jgi:hypothetical protein
MDSHVLEPGVATPTSSRGAFLKRGTVLAAAAVGAGALAGTAAADDDGASVFNVATAGAVPDGVTDNTAVLQGIFDGIRDQTVGERRGGVVYFPYVPGTGNTYCTKGLWVWSYTRIVADPGVEIRGTGNSSDLRSRSNGAGSPDINASGVFTLSPQEVVGAQFAKAVDGVSIEGVSLVNGAGTSYALNVLGATNCRFLDSGFYNGSLDAVMLQVRNGSNVPSNTISDARIERCTINGAGRNGVAMLYGTRVWITDCTISGCGLHGIDIEPNDKANPILQVFIEGCLAGYNAGAGIAFNPPPNGSSTTNTDHLIQGNVLRENHDSQLKFATGSGEAGGTGTVRVLGNNVSRGNGREALHADGGAHRLVVIGNYLRGRGGTSPSTNGAATFGSATKPASAADRANLNYMESE